MTSIQHKQNDGTLKKLTDEYDFIVRWCPRPYAGIFPGGARLSTVLEGKRKRGREAPERGKGVGGGVPPPTRGSFCIFEIEIERSGAHFGWIFFLGGGN